MSASTASTPDLRGIMETLAATPAVLRAILSSASEADAAWKPAPNRWSIAEVLGHLCHAEPRAFRGRVQRMVEEDNPALPGYNPDDYASEYTGLTMAEGLAEFERLRGETLTYLRSLPATSVSRSGAHSELGPVNVWQLLHEWPFHDLGHIRQIAEIIRARRFYPHMGPWQQIYKLNP